MSNAQIDGDGDALASWLGAGLEVNGDEAYALRREKPGFDPGPTTVTVPDWASSAGKIERAMSHLNEALPGGQRRRTALAMIQLQEGVQELAVWLRARGVIL